MEKQNKYTYLKVIQQNYGHGHGFEDVSEYETNASGVPKEWIEATKVDGISKRKVSLLREDLKSYRELGYPTRVIQRKVLN